MKRRKLTLTLTILAMVLLILDSRNTVRFAAKGIDLCIRTVIPSLFPFFVLSIYLTGNLGGSGVLPVLISGFLGGYPTGAQAAAQLWRTGRITRTQGNKLLLFCSQAGPSFLFGMVAAQFPERSYLWKLWAVQILSALCVFLLIPRDTYCKNIPADPLQLSLTTAMQRALSAMVRVCGWVVIFRVILGYLSALHLSETVTILLGGILELANGCMELKSVESLELRFFLGAIMLNFGGICVLLQTASVAEGLDIGIYLLGKLLQTGFCILISLTFLGHWKGLIPILLIFLLFRSPFTAKKGSIPAEIGV